MRWAIGLSATAMVAVLLAVQGALGNEAGARDRKTVSTVAPDGAVQGRITLNFNPDWKFTKSDPAGAAAVDFDDRAWATVSAPHTYNDTDTFDHWSLPGHRGEQNQWSGRTWYRKSFVLPESFRGRSVFIEFEGVRQVAEVYLNGRLLGVSKTGFTPFGFDLTPYLKFGGARNVLAVMCDNRFMKDSPPREAVERVAGSTAAPVPSQNLAQLSARVNQGVPAELDQLAADQIPWNNPHWHPAHGGIYRNVRLYVTDPLHITLPLYSFLQTTGPYVYAIGVSSRSALVTVEVPVVNGRAREEEVELRAELFDADDQKRLVLTQARMVAAGASAQFKVFAALDQPRFWEPDYPHLYRVVCKLRVKEETIDATEVPLGIRSVQWDATRGFFINGRHLKLHGWGQKPTDEWPGLGAAQPDWMHFYTLKLMKDAGGNFVRWGHSAAAPAMIAAGDHLGIIADQPGVDGESDTVNAAWALRTSAFRDTLIYFRNNPSILIWEGGNQKITREHSQELRGLMDRYDPHGGRVYAHRRADQVTAEFMDIGIGTEGGREISRLPVVEGEYDREESPRRVWDEASPPNFGYPEAKGQTYQLTSEQFAVNEVAQFVRKLGAAEHCGGANWIFSDSTSGGRVAVEVARASGEVDGVRLPKEAYYACAAMFRRDPQVHIIGHWTYPAGTKKTIYVVANGDDVELFVNGRSLGHGTPSDRYLFTFPDVAWEPGEIKAVSYAGGKSLATHTLHTAGQPVALKLSAITGPDGLRADGSDAVLIDVEAVDAKGERCPTFQQRVDFEFSGPGTWRGGYNSGKINSISNTFLDLEAGINRVAVRAGREPGQLVIRAKSEGLKPASITVPSQEFVARDGCSAVLPRVPSVALPAQVPEFVDFTTRSVPTAGRAAMPGKFTKAFNYSGPLSYVVHLETGARDGKNAYVDIDSPFVSLPVQLAGADWIQAANRDSLYNAVDLMEIAVTAGATIFVAHDERLTPPAWLTRQFQPASFGMAINGQPMKVFERHAADDESITLGANTEDTAAKMGMMYVVFINAVTK